MGCEEEIASAKCASSSLTKYVREAAGKNTLDDNGM